MGMVRPLPRMTPARRGNTVNCFATNSALKKLMPVRLPPGRARRVTRPRRTGSSGTMKTTGTVVVATFAANTTAVLYFHFRDARAAIRRLSSAGQSGG